MVKERAKIRIEKFIENNDHKNSTCHILLFWEVAKRVLREKLIALNIYSNKHERIEINEVTKK